MHSHGLDSVLTVRSYSLIQFPVARTEKEHLHCAYLHLPSNPTIQADNGSEILQARWITLVMGDDYSSFQMEIQTSFHDILNMARNLGSDKSMSNTEEGYSHPSQWLLRLSDFCSIIRC